MIRLTTVKMQTDGCMALMVFGEVVFMKKKMAALLLAFGVLAGCAPQGQQEPVSSQAGSSAAPEAQYEQVTLYLPNENADGMVEESAKIEVTDSAGKVEDMVQALVSGGALPEGTETLAVNWKDDCLSVDLNQAFADGIQNSGTAGETMILASLVNTLWAYYEPAELVLTVDGDPLETGHNIYDQPFTAPYTFE